MNREQLIEIAGDTAINLINKFGVDHYGFDADALEQFAARIIELESPRIRAEALKDASKSVKRRAHMSGDFQTKIEIMGCAMELLNMADEAEAQHVAAE